MEGFESDYMIFSFIHRLGFAMMNNGRNQRGKALLESISDSVMKHWGLCCISFLLLLFGCTSTINLPKQDKTVNAFSDSQTALIMAADSSQPMRVYKITDPSDSLLLRTPSSEIQVNPDDPVLMNFVNRLYRTVRDSLSMGVGIAGPQVGILKRIIWVQRFDKEGFPFEVYLNPEIKQYSQKKQTCLEGCLSIPNRRDTLNTRAYAILLEYDKMDRSHLTEMVEDFTAVIFQHEIDHLDGILYLDHLEKEQQGAPHN